MVWVNELGPFQIEVLEDRLPDEVVSAFVQYLAANERICTCQAGRAETPGDDQPVVETVFIDVTTSPAIPIRSAAGAPTGFPTC
ncbi:MAG: hypothetical protein U0521_00255 [Anaerolineae bacterium]